MNKKLLIALADAIRQHNSVTTRGSFWAFTDNQLTTLADFCESQNPRFKRDLWLAYVRNECSKNGYPYPREAA